MKFSDFFKKLFQHFFPEENQDKSSLTTEDEDFISDSKTAILNQTSPFANGIIISIVLLAFLGLIWAYFATIEQITIGEGKVIPSSYVKVIQSLDGGIVSEILVEEGEMVKKDQILMRLDATRYKSDYEAGYTKYLILSATIARLNAEAQKLNKIAFPPEVMKHPELMKRENNLFMTRKEALQKEVKLLEDSYKSSKNQLHMYEELLPKGFVSKLEYLRAEQNSIDINRTMVAKKNEFYEKVDKDLTDYRGQLETLQEQLQTLQDKLIRTTIISPVNGVVKKINVTTIGGVITPGMEIMEIVPLNDSLLIEARIRPADIAFIHVGQIAYVKITAYDFSIYGELEGKVEYISADTVKPEKEKAVTETPYYVVKIRTTRNYLGSEHHKLVIMPGMTASVHIKTGYKTVLQYLLKPLIKAKEEALRER